MSSYYCVKITPKRGLMTGAPMFWEGDGVPTVALAGPWTSSMGLFALVRVTAAHHT